MRRLGRVSWPLAVISLLAAGLACGCMSGAPKARADKTSAQQAGSPLTTVREEPGSQAMGAYVEDAVSGDTIIVTLAGTNTSAIVQLAGVDAPEDTKRPEPGTEAARSYVRKLLPRGSAVEIEFVEPDWMRMQQPPTGWVWMAQDETGDTPTEQAAETNLPDTLVNARVVRDGYALAAPAAPTARFVDDLARIQSDARTNRLGIWSYTGFGLHQGSYVANTATGKFHRDTCESVDNIAAVDRYVTGKRQDLIDDGLTPCRKCWP